MEINYRSKEESNRLQQEAFLQLTGAGRFYAFLALSERMAQFPVKATNHDRWGKNFLIVIDGHGKQLEREH